MMNTERLKKRISVASKREPADLVIKNGRIIDVFNQEILEGDVAIADGMIVGIGDYQGKQIIDAERRYISPSFIDAHVHLESAMVTPPEFARAVLPHGVTAVVADPHEIANVAGIEGIRYVLEASENLPLDVFMMLPSCVPCTPFENAGAELDAQDLDAFYTHPRVLGLAEVMDYPSVERGENGMMAKLAAALQYTGRIDGHGAGLNAEAMNVCRTAGISTDHECVTAEDALERLRMGMYVLIREGSVAKDLKALLPVVNQRNARRFVFCTDDKHLDELIREGSVDHNVRLAVEEGMDPLLAIQMASLNAAECFGLTGKGAIAPGYEADFLLLDDLNSVSVHKVYKAGQLVAEKGRYTGSSLPRVEPGSQLTHTVQLPEVTERDLQIKLGLTRTCSIIGTIPHSLVTRHLKEDVQEKDGCFSPSVERDQLKMAVLERHQQTGNIGLGIVKGFGMKSGAIASTVAHDSHNLVAAGTNDADLLIAIQALKDRQGGLVVVDQEKIIASMDLPLAGLISLKSMEESTLELVQLHEALLQIGAATESNPFVTLSFLCLPVIPELKMTDLGLFDFTSFRHIPISC